MKEFEKQHIEVLRKNAAECCVLLKSDGSFPVSEPCKVMLIGSGARKTIKGGTGSGDVYSRFYITCEQGLENAGFTVVSKKWLDKYDIESVKLHEEFRTSLIRSAEEKGVSKFETLFGASEPEHDYDIPLEGEGDIAVYVLSRVSGEGNDRSDIDGDVRLTKTEIKDILALNKAYKKFILVLNVGGVVDLSPIVNKVRNILILSQLGVVTGDVLADIVLGKANPSGKLTTTWAAYKDYNHDGEFGDMNDTRYYEGVYVGYRYFDTVNKTPLFPFGYGLSYTSFDIVLTDIEKDKEKITVIVKVKNTGKVAGKEAVQLYIAYPAGNIDKPYQSLAAFAKTKELKAGESQSIVLEFSVADLAVYFEDKAQFILEKGEYILLLGNSSRATKTCAAVVVENDIVTQKLQNKCGKPDFKDFVYPNKLKAVYTADVPIIKITAEDIACKTIEYGKEEKIEPLCEKLTDEQLAYLCVGAYQDNESGSIVGASSLHVSGAAGETTNHLPEYFGDKSVIMADGPAGLRLIRYCVKTEKGTFMPLFNEVTETLQLFLSEEQIEQLLAIYENTPKDKIIEQFTTAIPIGTAVAQSFNPEFAELCGDIVGDEMEHFGVHLWLAPALNIHRNILCGRNFEYYSEDPLVSGKIAAGVCRGVGKHDRRSTTIKHYAANNQEHNRYNCNSQVSERAMREIYLKGFEICVKEGKPRTVMTSYNLLNGTHTSERKDLIDDILRAEFGFDGVVMTDWIVSSMNHNNHSVHPAAATSRIIKAGNDMTMGGSKEDFEEACAALKNGLLTRDDMLPCASRVIRLIKEFNPELKI